MSAQFEWSDYRTEDAPMVDRWLDAGAIAMTGLDMGWDDYWNAVLADAVNFPGCKDHCKLVSEHGLPLAVICFGCYDGVATVSEIVVAPRYRGSGYGTRILRELVTHAAELLGEKVDRFCAVIFPNNLPSQRAFSKAGFLFDCAREDEDGVSWNYICALHNPSLQ